MRSFDNKVNLVLISNRPNRAAMIHDSMQQTGISGIIRRLPPGQISIDCARQQGPYRDKATPDLIFFDFAHSDTHAICVLRKIAFGRDKVRIPIILLTSPETFSLLDAGEIDGGDAVMFDPLGLASFVGKLGRDRRDDFLKAVTTLYQFGPILVRTPASVLNQDARETAISA